MSNIASALQGGIGRWTAAAAVIAAGAAALGGCATPMRPETDAALREKVDFYWRYAALAAHVYDSKGAADGKLGMVLSSQWIRREVRESPAGSRARALFDEVGVAGLDAIKRPPVADEFAPAASDPAAERQRENNRFVAARPSTEEQCEIKDGHDPFVPIGEAMQEFGWDRVFEFNRLAAVRSWSVFVPDLAIDVWRTSRQTEDGVPAVEYAIVYRGTVGGGGWVSNLRALTAVTPFVWDQYRQARAATTEIVDQIDQLHAISDEMFQRPQKTRVFITAVGHSLGAGLASYSYLANKRISRVVGFDPSPVDGSGTIKLADRAAIDARKPVIDRDPRHPDASIFLVFERGEILSRIAACQSGPLWGNDGGPNVLCETVNFSGGDWLAQHSMSQLACKLYLKRAALAADAGGSSRPPH